MPNLYGMEGLFMGGLAAIIVGIVVTLRFRWEDRHKHPPAPPAPRR